MASSCSGSVIGGDPHEVGPAVDHDRVADGRGAGEVDPVAVRLLEQLRLLVLRGRVEPEPGRLHGEVPALLADPALAHVEHLLALEQRVHDRRPFLVRRCHVPTIGGPWTTPSCPDDLKLAAHVAAPPPPGARSGWCCATASRAVRVARRRWATPTRSSPTASPTRRAGRCSRSTSVAPARRTATSPRAGGSTTCAPRSACSTRATTCAACGSPASATAARSRCARRPTTTLVHGWRPSRRRARCSTGRADPGRLLAHARAMQMIRTPGLPADRDGAGCARSRASTRSRRPRPLDGRPLLVLHGVDDAEVPVSDARALADAARPERGDAAGARRRPPAAPRPACDRHAARVARPSGELSARASSSTSPSVVSSGIVFDHPVPRRSFAGSPTSSGTSTGRTRSGSTSSRTGRTARAMRRAASSPTLTPLPRADVVDPAGRAVLHDQPVGAHDVAHVATVAHRSRCCRWAPRRGRHAPPPRSAPRARAGGSGPTGPARCG